jgi:hypothetical protein
MLSTLFSRARQEFCNQHAAVAEHNDYEVKYESLHFGVKWSGKTSGADNVSSRLK